MIFSPVRQVLPGPNDSYVVKLRAGQTLTVSSRAGNLIAQRLARPSSLPNRGPLSTSYGDCGSSYVNITERYDNNRPAQMTTGFRVVHRAISYHWYVRINGPQSYVHTYERGGGLFFSLTWDGAYLASGPRGVWSADVNSFESFAILDDGEVCTSGGPYDQRRL